MKTARKAGFKQKASSKRQKYVLPNLNVNNSNKYMTSPGRMSLPVTDDFSHDDDLSIDDFESGPMSTVVPPLPTDAKTLERLSERSYVKDWQRLGICNSGSPSSKPGPDQFRLTSVNSVYMMCRRLAIVCLINLYNVIFVHNCLAFTHDNKTIIKYNVGSKVCIIWEKFLLIVVFASS